MAKLWRINVQCVRCTIPFRRYQYVQVGILITSLRLLLVGMLLRKLNESQMHY